MERDYFYVTTPIYYVNDRPHIGHAYTTILADVLARYHRLIGVRTHFLTGTDEHGQKVCEAAEEAGISPQEQADRTVVRFQDLWKRLEITNDDFIRTTEERHKSVVQEILQTLYDAGEIYRADYDGWYCVRCERFFTERDLADGNCPEEGCGRPVERLREANYFFRMSKYRDWLVEHINNNPDFIQPPLRRNETLGFLKKDLNDLCISRPKSRLNWGIPLPFDPDYVTYVWFDALVNYISAIGYLSDSDRFDSWWPATYHLTGKDILTTHTVYWPTMLKAMGIPLPRAVFSHGWWLVGRDKMSKSEGNVIDPMAFADTYGVDAFRYFLMAAMTPGQDASFTEEGFVRRYNADLANDLGNTLSRVVKLTVSHCDSKIPAPGDPGPDEDRLRETAIAAAKGMVDSVERMRIDQGLAGVAGVVREANRYLERRQPWTLAKQGEIGELGTILYTAAETLRVVGGTLFPVMPGKMTELRCALGIRDSEPNFEKLIEWGVLEPGTAVSPVKGLFPRVKSTQPDASASDAGQTPTGVALIEYADFGKVQLRTARILAADAVKGADKLLRLDIEIGEETRQIVAGIAQHYEPAELVGRTIVVVANLEPAKIRGIESNGMLLAASSGDSLRLIAVDGDVPSGCEVK